MGALTNNRKRGDDYYKSLFSPSSPIDQSYGHIAKKPKLSDSMKVVTPNSYSTALSNSTAKRVSQYPERKSGFTRVHAPERNTRFRSFSSVKNTEIAASFEDRSADEMGRFSFYFQRLEKARDAANRSLRYVPYGKQKEKEVIEIDSEDENQNRDMGLDDSSSEEVENVDFNGTKWKGKQRAVDNLQEQKNRMVEKRLWSFDYSGVTDASNANEKVDDEEKKGLMQLDQILDDSGEPIYKRLLDSALKSASKIASIKFKIESTEKHMQWYPLLRPQKKEEQIKKDVADECFIPLTKEEENEVSNAFSNFNRRKVLVTHESSNIDISGEKLQCLRPGAWLNDEVINLYLELLKEREKREPKKFLKCHFFNTFFYKKLNSGRGGYNFQSVRRWTTQRKLGYSLLDCDKIFVPIHKEIHWCLAIINKKDKKFQYLDSLKGVDDQVLSVLARYFVDEVKEKCGKCLDIGSWEQEFVMDLPEQANGYDCGMFMIKYADFYSRDIGLCFSQEHMPYFRRRTAKEILRLKAE